MVTFAWFLYSNFGAKELYFPVLARQFIFFLFPLLKCNSCTIAIESLEGCGIYVHNPPLLTQSKTFLSVKKYSQLESTSGGEILTRHPIAS